MVKTFTIIFDENCFNWRADARYNEMYIKSMIAYLKEFYDNKGYIYLNKIYDNFGGEWNPEYENIVWIKKYGDVLDIDYIHEEGGLKWGIKVSHN